MTPGQPSKLLDSLFQQIDPQQRITVLDVGGAAPETINFFSHYRTKLHYADLFRELPITCTAETADPVADESSNEATGNAGELAAHFRDSLPLARGTQLDICLFWDLFNYLDSAAMTALLEHLKPSLHNNSFAHCFAVHNLKSPQNDQQYGILQQDEFSVRRRENSLPGYKPHSQSRLKSLLHCFAVERSVLLPDGRLELLLKARL